MTPIMIEAMHPADWPAVRLIYKAGIDTGLATFETMAPEDWADWSAGKRSDCRLVARSGGRGNGIVGWAALSPTSKRPAYAGVAEVSIYVAPKAWGQGIGSRLMATLIEASEVAGVWTLTASIFPENGASVRLHQRHGFEILGRRVRIAQLHGTWRDTLLLERRSSRVGQ